MTLLFVRRVSPMLILAVGLAACDEDPTAPDKGEPAIVMDRTYYVARPRLDEGPHDVAFRVIATYHNTSDARVWLVPCEKPEDGPIWSVERAYDEADSGYSTIWGCAEVDALIPVEAGESRTDTIEVRGPTSWSEQMGHGELAGWFRMRYEVSACPAEQSCDAVPAHLTRSAPFYVMPLE